MFILDFRSGFKKLVEEYEQVITEKLKECLQLRSKIENRDSSLDFRKEIFRNIVKQICLQGRGADQTEKIMGDIEEKLKEAKIEWLPEYFLNDDAAGINLIKRFSDSKKKKIIKISNQLMSVSMPDWIKNLYNRKLNGHIIMGPKSDDDFLKEHGYFDRVPIDRHSERFLFRTGALHYYCEKYQPNPSDAFSTNYYKQYEYFQKAMKVFCNDFLSEIKIGDFDLGKNPGIVDLILWRHCGESEKHYCRNICGDKPKCYKCGFKNSCLQYLLEVS